MNREQVANGLLALLAVLALGGVAATLDASGGSGAGAGTDEGTGVGSGPRFSLGGGFEPIDTTVPSLPEWVAVLLGVLLLLVGAYGCYELYREYGLRRILGAAAAGIIAAVGVYLLLSLVRPSEPDLGAGPQQGEPSLPSGGAGAAETAARAVDPPTALLAALGVLLLGAVAVILRATGDQRVGLEDAAPTEEPPSSDVTAVAAAAGRAADRIEADTDVDNAVYRAWREMTADLPVANPDASTPAEFADAAVEAGMDPDDVAELTELFETVRYGDRPVTETRAERATAALRRIERTYGEEAYGDEGAER